MVDIKRCDWALKTDIEKVYHDNKWGIPLHDERELFKMLIMEGMQAGLSWVTILRKMNSFCEAFDNFDPSIIMNYDETKVEELMQNNNIIRNRRKINAAINNSKAYFKLCEEFGSLDNYFWSFVDYKPIINSWTKHSEVPANTELSDKISKDLKKRGFGFVGSTIIYSFMQSVGMVNDHLTSCHCYSNCLE